ncbi:2,5-dihydroxypyridine 5,6-dioxygenase [Variovorax sp. EBFNA2]|uniref:2,5-dihydroxypyridine 5,6-dioxygenase n=1 Tax=Variovorax sp. EBFNA2 TaxID=3342097 RepID=UPI0029C0B50E|nr:2,5-dihydroxypyridine 5,6-dioxygenase [Variovorax boronicumulans]WPG41303.1 2,5-dihydroxypyridine 5,6-dioxygenase [Variovorax boronicumulans]
MKLDVEMFELFTRELELCRVKPGENIVVLTADDEWQEHAQAFMAAAAHLGATTFNMNLRRGQKNAVGVQGRHPLVGNALAMTTLKSASMVIDMVGLLFSREQAEIQAAGVRILRVMEPFHVLKQMFPTADLQRRVEYAKGLLESARQLRFTSDAGTDIVYKLGQYPVISEYGFTAEAGRWDHFPSGFSFTQGDDGGVDGVVVMQPGDILCTFKKYVESPVTLRVEKGYVVEITGQGLDAQLIRSYIDSFNDPRAYAISHIGWGLNEKARWYQFSVTRQLTSEHVMNALSFYGNVLFSLGPNLELGGTNDTACHLDLPMRNCNLWLDEVQILKNGEVIHPEMRVELTSSGA